MPTATEGIIYLHVKYDGPNPCFQMNERPRIACAERQSKINLGYATLLKLADELRRKVDDEGGREELMEQL
jgi:hypothetical protein